MVVLEVEPTVRDSSLRRVLHGREQQIRPETLAADRQRINSALAAVLIGGVECAGPQLKILAAADYPDVSQMGRPLSRLGLEKLHGSYPADEYIRLRITDYGETPKRWEGTYVTFEVVTTLGIAAALYAHKVTRAIAGAYLLEESIEEFGEGYAGFWALNRLSRPVRIETDILDGETGQLLRRDTHVGLARWRWRHLWHMDDSTRDQLLEASMRKALRPLIANVRQLCQ